jgi:hypothetical protein
MLVNRVATRHPYATGPQHAIAPPATPQACHHSCYPAAALPQVQIDGEDDYEYWCALVGPSPSRTARTLFTSHPLRPSPRALASQ